MKIENKKLIFKVQSVIKKEKLHRHLEDRAKLREIDTFI